MASDRSPAAIDYTIGWICSLADELVVAEAMLDERYSCPLQSPSDYNIYTVGRVATYNIVVACLPAGLYGTSSATRVAEQMQYTFPTLKFTLMVGIGGGAPSGDHDIRLGDVVVSQPVDGHGGVMHYRFGKIVDGRGFQCTGFLNKPPQMLLNVVEYLKSKHRLHESSLPRHLAHMIERHEKLRGIFEYQGQEHDRLFLAEYSHTSGKGHCDECDLAQTKSRPPRRNHDPVVHYGLIASGDVIMKDAVERNTVQQQYGILCFEMEAAGLMNGLDCLVIRGISDYSDSHKNDRWRPYAAAAAAAYAKELICSLPVQDAKRRITSQLSYRGLEAAKVSATLRSQGTLNRPIYLNIYPRNNRFFGRNDILQAISQQLFPAMAGTLRLQSFALYGLAGIGKSQIATEFVYRSMKMFSAIFWVSASSTEKLFQGFTDIARELNLSKGAAIDDQWAIVQLVDQWLMSTVEPWLLVLDNADDLSIIEPFWPTSDHGAVLVTSQNPASGYQLANMGMETKPFSPQESSTYFCEQLGGIGVQENEARQITESFGHHTLTIKQMASCIRESKCSISQFREPYADSTKRRQLLATPNEFSAPGYSHTTATAFGVTFSKLSIDSLCTLGMLSFFDPDRIPETLLEDKQNRIPHLADIISRHTIMRDLGRYSLIDKLEDEANLRLHRIVAHTVAEEIDSDEAKVQRAFQSAVAMLHQYFPLQSESRSHMNEKWTECEKYLFERGRFDLSFSIVGSAELVYNRADLQDHGLLLADLYSLQADMYNELSQAEKAVEFAKRSLKIKEQAVADKALDKHHPQLANSYMDIGVFIAGMNPRGAIRLHEKAIVIREGSPKYADDQMQLLSLNYMNIGRCWWMVKELDKATAAYEKSISIIKELEEATGAPFAHEYLNVALKIHLQKSSIDTRPEIARTMFQLSQLLHDVGQIEEGGKLKAEAQKLRFQLAGKLPGEEESQEAYDELVAYFYR
ncbi:pfs domain-containing protein [Histoplasma capsulatum H143]|uniref:Pfs domain-containing protein n=1 Tax=Ajellomyces capsulatus (strain H143) TaxID=544712 RepID=C6HMY8_AJECH|nr:pfs domain-containing protein [Histoplasma capsulatum H143]